MYQQWKISPYLHLNVVNITYQDATTSLADHLAGERDEQMEEEEMIRASGAYHPERYNRYQQHMQQKMAQR
jgi:hypothetical protein